VPSPTPPKALSTLPAVTTVPTVCPFLQLCPISLIVLECINDTPVRCNGQCVAVGACPSGLPQRRALKGINADLLCPTDLSACGLPNRLSSLWGKIECVDTMTNLDSCKSTLLRRDLSAFADLAGGGCEWPLPGRPKGVDCSAIDYAGDVSCVRGECVLHTCQKGYTVKGLECVKDEPSPAKRSRRVM
jgi:hypothetical protein